MTRKLVLKATGEVAELVLDATQSGGERVEFITSLPLGAEGPPLHIHARQSERFEVIEGTLMLDVNGKTVQLRPGEVYAVPPGTPHRFDNHGPGLARWHVRVEPALNFDYLAEAMIGLANSAYPGTPGPEQLAYVLDQAAGEYYLAESSRAEQDAKNWQLAGKVIADVPDGPMSLSAYRQRQRTDGAS